MRIWRPQVFQGSLKRKRYFEGWYFKQVSRKLDHAYAFIPGVSLAENDPHAFIQVIDGITGATEYHAYGLDEFHYDTRELSVRVGKSVFTGKGFDLDIAGREFRVRGSLEFAGTVPFPGSFFSPGIMGWYSFVPFMECYHAVVSMRHLLSGSLEINSRRVDFGGGTGYIEKDWGRSFPESWIWLHCNTFEGSDASLMVSIAKIPWLGRFFIGFIGFLYAGRRLYQFHTHNGSTLSGVRHDGATLGLTLRHGPHTLAISAEKSKSGELAAPVRGSMSRHIKESIDSRVHVTLTERSGTTVFEGKGTRAGLEIIDAIFEHLEQ